MARKIPDKLKEYSDRNHRIKISSDGPDDYDKKLIENERHRNAKWAGLVWLGGLLYGIMMFCSGTFFNKDD